MAAAEATTEPEWLDRAEKMTAFAYKVASKNGWRIPSSSTRTRSRPSVWEAPQRRSALL